MYAMLGDVRFETLQSFSSLEAQHSAKFAKHEVLKGRPRLQAMENELTTLRFGLKLHWMLGNPRHGLQGLAGCSGRRNKRCRWLWFRAICRLVCN